MGIKILFFFLLLCSISPLLAQNDTIKFWIQFTDKNNSPHSILNPEEFLSSRAIARRNRQGIPIVENDLPVNPFYIDSVLNSGNFKLHNTSKWLNGITVKTNDSSNILALNGVSFIQHIENTQRLAVRQGETDPFLENKGLVLEVANEEHYPYGKTYNQIHLHKLDHLHEYGFLGQGMHIAVIDAGFYNADKIKGLEHLFDEGRILSIKDFVEHDHSVFEDNVHGAMVLSIIAGSVDGVFQGTAPKASFHLLRSEDANSETRSEEDNWISAAEYADSAGVDIINTSLGYTLFDDTLQNYTYNEMDGNTTRIAIASDIAASKGILLVTSAGNSGDSPWRYISTPADADSVLTVAAVDSLGQRASFSSVGFSADGDIKPNIASVGWHTYYLSPWDSNLGEVSQGNGTSFSAPMVTGMVACLWQGLPRLSNMQIKQLVEESSNQYQQPDSLIGYGIPDFDLAYQKATGVVYTSPKNKLFRYYPNPFHSVIHFELLSNKSQNVEVKIKNTQGQELIVFSQNIQKGRNLLTVKSLANWKQGIYLLEITFEDHSKEVRKLIKTSSF